MTNGEKEKAIEYFKWWKSFNEQTQKAIPKDTIAYKAYQTEIGFYDMAIKALEQESITKNNLGVEEHKGEVMDFPNTFDEFAEDYGFRDKEEVYTNGSELIQVYRVKQWLEHINKTTTMIDKSNFSQEQYKADLQSAYDCGYEHAKNDLEVDAVSRQAVLDLIADYDLSMGQVVRGIHALPLVTPQEPRWIPVSERLPEKNVEVLVATKSGYVTIAEWFEYDHWFIHEGLYNAHTDELTAWMPLPPSYSEVEE